MCIHDFILKNIQSHTYKCRLIFCLFFIIIMFHIEVVLYEKFTNVVYLFAIWQQAIVWNIG